MVGRDTLRALRRAEVLVRTWPSPHAPVQYFRIMDPETPVCLGPDGHFYEHDEYEMACLERGCTPFSRTPIRAEAEIAQADRHYVNGEPTQLAAQHAAQQEGGGPAAGLGVGGGPVAAPSDLMRTAPLGGQWREPMQQSTL